ncbi:MAG: efflux RND transporter permease subunit, partial [Acidaminobacteraceae bacterium]
MKKLIRYSIKQRKITVFILIMLLLLGIYSYYIMPKQENPDISAPISMITVVYPGASPNDIDELVTSKIEDEVEEIDGFDYSYSHSAGSVSVVILRIKYGTDIDAAWADLRSRMDDLQSELPSECEKIIVNTDLTETAGMMISMSGENYSYEELEEFSEDLREKLSDIDGISRFDIVGKQNKNLIIEVDYEKLNYFSLSYNDLINLLKSQNIEIPSGTIDSAGDKISVKSTGKLQSIDEIENLIIGVSRENGSTARLVDIAKVYYELEESSFQILQDSKEAVLLTGYFESGKNVVMIGREVSDAIEEFSSSIPPDIEFYEAHYQPDTVEESVGNFIANLSQGVFFVIIVVFIGMGFRNSIIVSTAIPSSILITIFVIRYMGIQIHQISVAALIVSLGMLVDNAIVVSDSIQVKIDDGEDKLKACVDGTYEVAIPVLTSTLTTVAAFLPLLLLTSIAGEYISSLPTIIMISLGVSYLIAIFVTPVMAFWFFEKSKKKKEHNRTRDLFSRVLKYGLINKKVIIAASVMAIIGTGFLTLQLGLQFFPFADSDIIYIDLKTEKVADIDKTKELALKTLAILDKEAEVKNHTVAIGGGLPKFYNTLPLVTPSQDAGQLMVKIDLDLVNSNYGDLSTYVDNLQSVFDSQIYGGVLTVKQLEQGEPIGSPVRIRIIGEDIEELGKLVNEIKTALSDIPGTTNIDDDFSDEIYQYVINTDNKKANYFGLTKYDIQNEVSIALRGRNAGVFRSEGKEFDIIIRSDINNKTSLENLGVKSSFIDSKLALKTVAKVELSKEYPYVKKYNGKKSIQVYSDVKVGYSSVDIQNQLSQKLKTINLGNNKIVFDGEREKIRENFGDISEQAILSIFLVFLILLIQFKGFAQPLIILTTIPLSIVGAILGLFIFRQNLSFVAALGIVSLLGIVVNNAIVLIDFIDTERAEGKTVNQSCMDAVEKRFRPIILSTITTVIGLTPLAVTGGTLFKPMAIALMSGLI